MALVVCRVCRIEWILVLSMVARGEGWCGLAVLVETVSSRSLAWAVATKWDGKARPRWLVGR